MEAPPPGDLLRAKLNLETARISWAELQIFFARGVTLHVRSDLDLVDVARVIASDDKVQFEQWMATGQVANVTDVEAADWIQRDTVVWAVVTKPWVLVQPCA